MKYLKVIALFFIIFLFASCNSNENEVLYNFQVELNDGTFDTIQAAEVIVSAKCAKTSSCYYKDNQEYIFNYKKNTVGVYPYESVKHVKAINIVNEEK